MFDNKKNCFFSTITFIVLLRTFSDRVNTICSGSKELQSKQSSRLNPCTISLGFPVLRTYPKLDWGNKSAENRTQVSHMQVVASIVLSSQLLKKLYVKLIISASQYLLKAASYNEI